MWSVSVLFFAYQFIMRVFPGLTSVEIMHKFQVSATEFGLLSSMYYYGYAGMQIPVAFLLDRYGPRLIISLSCLLCAGSTFLFYTSEHWSLVLLARFLLGAGSAAGFLGTSKIICMYFPISAYARMVGISFTLGLMGAIYGGRPVSLLISQFGWEQVLLIISGVGLVMTVLLALVLKPYDASQYDSGATYMQGLKKIFSMPSLLFIALVNLLMVGPLEGFADVWGVPYLVTVYSFTRADAALITSAIFVGMLFGGPILAFISDRYKAAHALTAFCGLFMAGIFTLMLVSKGGLSFSILLGLMFFVGILCCYQVLIFSIGSNLVPFEMRNITVAFLNCINMLGGSFFHTMIGSLMDFFWTGNLEAGQRVYEPQAFGWGLSIIPAAAFLGGMLLLMLKPSKRIATAPTGT